MAFAVVDDLHKRYRPGAPEAVAGVSFEVSEGEASDCSDRDVRRARPARLPAACQRLTRAALLDCRPQMFDRVRHGG
jgi:hypothetical protein